MTDLIIPRDLMSFFNDSREIQRYFNEIANATGEYLQIANLFETPGQVIVTNNGNGTLTLSTPQNIDTDADVEFDSITLGDLTPLRMTSADANKKVISISDLTAWILGTDLQTVNDDGDGTVSLNDDELEFYIQAVA